jgi:hypothetical protein
MAVLFGALTVLYGQGALAQRRHGGAHHPASTATSTADAGAANSTATPAAATGDAGAAAPEPTAAAPAGDAAVAAPADAGLTGEQYVVRLRDLEQRINELKEEIFRSKARLSLLAESVLQNVVGGARAVITHENEMGNSFRLVRAVYALDGAPILTRSDDNGSLGEQHQFPVYNGQLGAGDHTLTVNLEYQGNGFGIFSYVKGYTFRVRSTSSFSVPDGKAIQIRVVGYEKGGPTTPPEDRPAVRYITRIMSLRDATESEQASDQTAGGISGAGTSGAGGTTGGTSGGGTSQQGGSGTHP